MLCCHCCRYWMIKWCWWYRSVHVVTRAPTQSDYRTRPGQSRAPSMQQSWVGPRYFILPYQKASGIPAFLAFSTKSSSCDISGMLFYFCTFWFPKGLCLINDIFLSHQSRPVINHSIKKNKDIFLSQRYYNFIQTSHTFTHVSESA